MLVFQNSFRNLQTRVDGVSVVLSFGGIERSIAFSYFAIRQVRIPEIGLTLALEAEDSDQSEQVRRGDEA